ncbi:hypothetical protein, partial [Pseudomonas sp.]|uniref:hypothetical protein n=1 Tax=Pseudomonas sp. TaxID=306 RepID=UPI0028ADD8E4
MRKIARQLQTSANAAGSGVKRGKSYFRDLNESAGKTRARDNVQRTDKKPVGVVGDGFRVRHAFACHAVTRHPLSARTAFS